MRFEARDAVSDPGGTVNDDRHGLSAAAAWVLDGATGVAAERVLPGPSDATWLVDRIDGALREELRAGPSPDILLRRAVRRAAAAFPREALRPDAPACDMPSTGLAMARLRQGGLELANLGDCLVLHRRRGGGVAAFGSSRLAQIDAATRREVARLSGDGVPQAEIWQRLLPAIRRNRGLMNQPEGYWILDLGGSGIDHLEVRQAAAEPGDALLLLSDGFYRLVDTYARYDYVAMVEAALRHGLAPLLAELRAIEAGDHDGRRYPRLKLRDDATAVLVEITAS